MHTVNAISSNILVLSLAFAAACWGLSKLLR